MVKVSNVWTWIASQALKPVKTVPSLFGCLSKRRQTKTSTLQCQNRRQGRTKTSTEREQSGLGELWVGYDQLYVD